MAEESKTWFLWSCDLIWVSPLLTHSEQASNYLDETRDMLGSACRNIELEFERLINVMFAYGGVWMDE